jgi:hypothetical protein
MAGTSGVPLRQRRSAARQRKAMLRPMRGGSAELRFRNWGTPIVSLEQCRQSAEAARDGVAKERASDPASEELPQARIARPSPRPGGGRGDDRHRHPAEPPVRLARNVDGFPGGLRPRRRP